MSVPATPAGQLRFTAILAGGAVSALCILWLLRGLPLGGAAMWLSPLPLLAVALTFGVADAGLALLVAALPLLLLAGWHAMVSHMLTVGLPVLLCSALGLAVPPGSPPRLGLPVVALAMLGALVFLLVGLAMMDQPGGLHGWLLAEFQAQIQAMVSQGARQGAQPPNAETLAKLAQMAHLAAHALPVAMGFWYLGAMALNATLAQRLVQRFGLGQRPPVLFKALELPRWFWPLPLLLAALVLVLPEGPRYLAGGVAEILLLPFLMVGLAVVHTAAGRASSPRLALFAFYLAFFVLLPVMLVVIGLGFAERWANLRGRISARANSGTRDPPEDRT